METISALAKEWKERKLNIEIIQTEVSKVVLVVGKTGTGKSTIINMLFNNSFSKDHLKKPCKIGNTSSSVTKKSCVLYSPNNKILYYDTMGFSDPDKGDFEIAMGIKDLIRRCHGGVNSIIVVLKYGRMSKEERLILDIIKEIFDDRWKTNCIVVATHYDGRVNEDTQEVDEEIKKEKLNAWTNKDKEIQKFFGFIDNRIILTDMSLERFEAQLRPLRAQCLQKLNEFIESSTETVGAAPKNIFEVIKLLLERWFSSYYSLKESRKRLANVVEYLTKQAEVAKTGDCAKCQLAINFAEMVQTNCEHIFHVECFKAAVDETSNSCPLCGKVVHQIFHPHSNFISW